MEIKLVIALNASTLEALENLTSAIAGQKSTPAKAPKTKIAKAEGSPEPVAPDATIEDVRKVFVEKKRAGFSNEIKEILKSFKVTMVSNLDPKDYDDVIALVNELGK